MACKRSAVRSRLAPPIYLTSPNNPGFPGASNRRSINANSQPAQVRQAPQQPALLIHIIMDCRTIVRAHHPLAGAGSQYFDNRLTHISTSVNRPQGVGTSMHAWHSTLWPPKLYLRVWAGAILAGMINQTTT